MCDIGFAALSQVSVIGVYMTIFLFVSFD